MKKDALRTFLSNAGELEKRYEWLQATEFYQKAIDQTSKKKDFRKGAEIHEKMGFSFYRSAFQSQTNIAFRKRLKLAIQAYQGARKLLAKIKEKNSQAKSLHAKAFIIYIRSWLETNPLKKKKLLDEWWILENKALTAYEFAGDTLSAGKICVDLVEYSYYNRFWLVSNYYAEHEKVGSEAFNLAERAIKALSKLDDNYELTRAYCFASYFYSYSSWFCEDKAKLKKIRQKWRLYSKKSLELSAKTGDARLICWAYIAASHLFQLSGKNQVIAVEYGEKALEYGRIAKNNFLVGYVNSKLSLSYLALARSIEDPDKQKEGFEKAGKSAQHATSMLKNFNYVPGFSSLYHSMALHALASIETDSRKKQYFIQLSAKIIRKGMEHARGWKRLISPLSFALSENLNLLSETISEIQEKRQILNEAQFHAKNYIAFQEKMVRFRLLRAKGYYDLALVQRKIGLLVEDKAGKINFFKKAVKSIRKCIQMTEDIESEFLGPMTAGVFIGPFYYNLGEILQQIHFLTRQEKNLSKAIKAFNNAVTFFKKGDLLAHVAESYWHIAQLKDQLGVYHEASKNYELAAEAYDQASEKILPLKKFYNDYSVYMRAWSQIEQARHNHSIEEYKEARHHYEKASKLHQSTEPWSYLAPKYFALASMEEAEGLSRKEKTQQAKEAFQKALDQFTKTEGSIKLKVEKITSIEEKELTLKLLESSDLRRKFCQARIQIEEAKLLDRQGKYLRSSKRYREAAQNISALARELDVEAERKEMEYIAILCQAWEKMALAEETTSSEPYLEAARLFEQAKEYCYTKKASLWALGNSNFCRGLAAGAEYQTFLDVKAHSKAKGYIQNAASNYFKAGYKNASKYAKGALRLFDAYLFMDQAEKESDTEKRIKKYHLTENLLQLASGSFMEAKQSEKAAQVKQILANIREEKELAISFNEVLQAPSIASTTHSFSAPSPTREVSVGLEKLQHANVQANLIAGLTEVKVGESFCLSVEFVNAGKEPALLTRVEDFVPPDFVVVKKPEIYRLEESCLNMKGKQIAPLKLVEAKLVLQPSKKGVYQLKPTIHYLDELGQNKSLQFKTVEIKVEEIVLANRISTGTRELDSLLLGGIPKEYAVVLTGPPSDERELIVKNFLEAGAKEGQTSFYVTTEAVGLERLLKKPGFHLFLCNPKPKVEVPDLPNLTRLRSKTDLTNLNISLLKAYRNVKQSSSKRVCIGIISDVLVDHGVKNTRKWISELTTDLVSKGFTVLAVINPLMHTSEELYSILDLFDGEISLYQTEDPLECKKSIRIKKLRNQEYIKNPICLT